MLMMKIGVLIPFSAFYDTIEEFLNPTITTVIKELHENRTKRKFDECRSIKSFYL